MRSVFPSSRSLAIPHALNAFALATTRSVSAQALAFSSWYGRNSVVLPSSVAMVPYSSRPPVLCIATLNNILVGMTIPGVWSVNFGCPGFQLVEWYQLLLGESGSQSMTVADMAMQVVRDQAHYVQRMEISRWPQLSRRSFQDGRVARSSSSGEAN